MSAVLGQKLGAELCKIFGLDRVMSLKIDIERDSAVMFHVEQYMDARDADGFLSVMRRYELVELSTESKIDRMVEDAKNEIQELTDSAYRIIKGNYVLDMAEMFPKKLPATTQNNGDWDEAYRSVNAGTGLIWILAIMLGISAVLL